MLLQFAKEKRLEFLVIVRISVVWIKSTSFGNVDCIVLVCLSNDS